MFYEIYYSIYVIALTLSLITILLNLKKRKLSNKINVFFIFLFSVFFILVFGTRSEEIGTDTKNYFIILESFQIYSVVSIKDQGFNFLLLITSIIGKKSFLFLTALFYITPLYMVFTRLRFNNRFILFFIFTSSFFFLSMGINIMRQGIALSFIIYALFLYLQNNNKVGFYICCAIAVSFHLAVFVFVPLVLVIERISIKSSIVMFLIAIIISYFGIGLIKFLNEIPIIKHLLDSRFDSYVNSSESAYSTGFRVDFLVYNSFYIFISYFYVLKKQILPSLIYDKYIVVFKLYVILSSLFVLCFHIPYSDRVGIMSWVLSPFLLLPLYIPKQIQKNMILALFTIAFNVFIFIII